MKSLLILIVNMNQYVLEVENRNIFPMNVDLLFNLLCSLFFSMIFYFGKLE